MRYGFGSEGYGFPAGNLPRWCCGSSADARTAEHHLTTRRLNPRYVYAGHSPWA